MNNTPAQVASLLLEGDKYLIVTHKSPDGDTIGSATALCGALRRAGKTAFLFNNPQIVEKYAPYIEGCIAPVGYEYSRAIAVDVASDDMRARGYEGDFWLCIDHHPTNPGYAEHNLIRPESAACAMIILQVIKELTGSVTADEATLLYIGLTTDTACFRHGNTDPAALRAGAELLELGARSREVIITFFEKSSAARLRFESELYSAIRLYLDGKVAAVIVSREMVEKTGVTENDLEDLSNLVTRVDGPVIGVTVKELENGEGSKISLRGLHAAEVCSSFGGGGHAVAAGCSIKEPPEKALEMIINALKEALK